MEGTPVSATGSTAEALAVARKIVADVDLVRPGSNHEVAGLRHQVGLLSAAILALAEAVEHQDRP